MGDFIVLKSSLFVMAALAGLSLAACTPSDAKRSPQPSDQAAVQAETPNYDQALTEPSLAGCEVVLGQAEQAIDTGTATLDKAAVQAARAKYQAQLEAGYPNAEERAQLVGSTAAFHDQLTPEALKASAEVCLAAQDQTLDPANG